MALWVGGVVAPILAQNFFSTLKAVKTGPGFECRYRNREAARKVSAHAVGFALDISAFEVESGRVLSFGLDDDTAAGATLRTVRTAACGWFTTVLGPGSDVGQENIFMPTCNGTEPTRIFASSFTSRGHPLYPWLTQVDLRYLEAPSKNVATDPSFPPLWPGVGGG